MGTNLQERHRKGVETHSQKVMIVFLRDLMPSERSFLILFINYLFSTTCNTTNVTFGCKINKIESPFLRRNEVTRSMFVVSCFLRMPSILCPYIY